MLPADMATIRRIRRSKHLDEELLPGIPNAISLDLISPKLPWREFYTLSRVSHAWRNAIQSHLVYDARVRSFSTETLVVLLYSKRVRLNPTQIISLYSTIDKTLNELPPIPVVWTGIPFCCQCVSLGGKIYVLGGLKHFHNFTARSEVFVLDLAGERQWKQCASMWEPRMEFGCCVKDGKIFVFGGSHRNNPIYGSEAYDPKVNSWSPIKRMISLRVDHKVLILGEELVAHGGDFLYPSSVEWDNDHPFIHASESSDDAEEDPHIDEAKDVVTDSVDSSDVEPEDLIDPIESGDNEAEDRRIVTDYVQWLMTSDSSDDDEPTWNGKKAKFFEIYHPVRNEWRFIEPSESNCLGRVFTAQGKLYQMANNNIYVQDIYRDSWTILQSYSTAEIGHPYHLPYAILAVDHELLAIVPWYSTGYAEIGVRLLQSTGFGNKNKKVVWETAKSLLFSKTMWPPFLDCSPLTCLIQL